MIKKHWTAVPIVLGVLLITWCLATVWIPRWTYAEEAQVELLIKALMIGMGSLTIGLLYRR